MTDGRIEADALAMLLDIRLPVEISFGRTNLPLAELIRLKQGSVIELDGDVAGEVELRVHDRVIATGQVVDVDGNYGIRIVSRQAAGVTAPAAVSPRVEADRK